MVNYKWASSRVGVAALVALSFLSACKKKTAANPEAPGQTPISTAPAPTRPASLLPPVAPTQYPSKFFTGKLRINYNDGENNVGANATLRVASDSLIWLSLSPALGIEAARVLITRDSIFIMNRIENEVTVLAIRDAEGIIGGPVTFTEVQGLIMGTNPYDGSRFNPYDLEGVQHKRYETPAIKYKLRLNPKGEMALMQLQSNHPQGGVIDGNFQGHKGFQGISLPEQRYLTIMYSTQAGTKATLKLDSQLTKGEFTSNRLEFPFDVPRHFNRVKL